ncbi:hypothetical protein FIBSPDRAFT_961941 [Athelia psychrophila]|uniref:Uncharacterized protein n=1 Tax=Athelia psychrophila TaxID=1759441 RepID=A0A166AR56_9AGAM|nr:hypothetical protein FIBSPDRAFT_961941 [Fibularhizoctonia sp. CBS 109695]
MSSKDTTSQSDISKMTVHAADGSFKRPASSFRNTIEKGGKFEVEKDRYHLYVSYACPWATRALIVRKLKGLDEIIRGASCHGGLPAHGKQRLAIRKRG